MKYLIAFTALVIATALNSLSWPVQTGIGISLFAGLFIFAVKTAHTPWRMPEMMQDALKLISVVILIAVTAALLVALAATGQDLSFQDALLMVVKSLPRMFDV